MEIPPPLREALNQICDEHRVKTHQVTSGSGLRRVVQARRAFCVAAHDYWQNTLTPKERGAVLIGEHDAPVTFGSRKRVVASATQYAAALSGLTTSGAVTTIRRYYAKLADREARHQHHSSERIGHGRAQKALDQGAEAGDIK